MTTINHPKEDQEARRFSLLLRAIILGPIIAAGLAIGYSEVRLKLAQNEAKERLEIMRPFVPPAYMPQ